MMVSIRDTRMWSVAILHLSDRAPAGTWIDSLRSPPALNMQNLTVSSGPGMAFRRRPRTVNIRLIQVMVSYARGAQEEGLTPRPGGVSMTSRASNANASFLALTRLR